MDDDHDDSKNMPDLVLKKSLQGIEFYDIKIGTSSIFNMDNLKDDEFNMLIQNFFENDEYVDKIKHPIIYSHENIFVEFSFGHKKCKVFFLEKNGFKKKIIKFFNFLKNTKTQDFCYYSRNLKNGDDDFDNDIVHLIGDIIKKSNTIEYVSLPASFLKENVFKILHSYMINHQILKHLEFRSFTSPMSNNCFNYMNDIIKSSNIEDIKGLYTDEYGYIFENLLDNFFRGKNPNLKIRYRYINDDLVFKLSDVIKKKGINYLTEIDLSSNEITSKGFSILVDSLLESKNFNIIKINMNDNKLDDDCIEKLGELIKKNENMLHIDFSCNKIMDKGIETLSNYIVGNVSIKSIKLYGNYDVTDTCFKMMKHMVKSSSISSIGYHMAANVEYMKEIKELLKIPIEEREIPLITFQDVKSASKRMKE